MGLFFNRDKMSSEAGEWAALAMACMVYADGNANEEEIEVARRQAASNPVIKKSIGAERARAVFDEAVQAIFEVPAAMLASYETRLQTLAAEIDKLEEKNFALTTVIAVAMGDQRITQAEHDMLTRFKEALGATIPVPAAGESVPAVLRQAAQQQPDEAAVSDESARVVMCRECGKLTTHYEKYGFWCAACEVYTEPDVNASDEPGAGDQTAATTTGAAPLSTRACPSCGDPAQLYPGYGYWCTPCQRYADEDAAEA